MLAEWPSLPKSVHDELHSPLGKHRCLSHLVEALKHESIHLSVPSWIYPKWLARGQNLLDCFTATCSIIFKLTHKGAAHYTANAYSVLRYKSQCRYWGTCIVFTYLGAPWAIPGYSSVFWPHNLLAFTWWAIGDISAEVFSVSKPSEWRLLVEMATSISVSYTHLTLPTIYSV